MFYKKKQLKKNIFWFRRDLRIIDNAALYHALKDVHPVLPIFIFDEHILEDLKNKSDARVQFIHEQIENIKNQLIAAGSDLLVFYGKPVDIFKELISTEDIDTVFTNRDYEPYAMERDRAIQQILESNSISFQSCKDHVIFEGDEILKSDGKPYTVFTPYSRKWKEKLTLKTEEGLSYYLKSYPSEKHLSQFFKTNNPTSLISLAEMGFSANQNQFPSAEVKTSLIKNYDSQRNFPGINGTSRLGIHFRFGTISIREKARKSLILNETFLNELIWRDFYSQILFHFPRITLESFKTEYDRIEWRNDYNEFLLWCEGKTGYPLVDAGMRELNQTGFMHNRVRMVVASFLVKHLLIDWRWGEAYFAEKLLDFDLASNNGGWQWAAGSGTDAAPYFRIFNPTTQQEKFDKDFSYIRKWIPEWGSSNYPKPIVDHSYARDRCLDVFKKGLSK